MSRVDEPTNAETRALAELRALALYPRRADREAVLDYVYDVRHLKRVRRELRDEGTKFRAYTHERGVRVQIVAVREAKTDEECHGYVHK